MKSRRNQYLLQKYGITEDQYNLLLKKQGGGCAICGKTPTQEKKSLAVDHCHKPPFEIRGLLCSYCNHRLVGRHTDAELLRRIAGYVSQGTGWFVPVKKKRKKKRKKHVRRD